MKLVLIRCAIVVTATAVASGVAMRAQQPPGPGTAAQPVPRTADGRIALGNTATVKGVWVASGDVLPDGQRISLGFCNSNTVAPPASLNPGAGRGTDGARATGAGGRAGGRGAATATTCTPIPYMAWTRAVSDDRRRNELEPHTRCKPSGGPRQWLTPYGAELLELPEQKLAYIFDIGGPHTYRTIFMDGRKHPQNLEPSYYGHSIGWWEGDTLVVDTIGFNEGFWIDRGQLPHTTQLHLIEKYTRTALNAMKYELTVEDPGAYTAPFTGTSTLRWENGTELFEYVCQQGNEAHTLMVGDGTSVDRSSPIVP